MVPKEDTTAELQVARIKRDKSDCQKVTRQILSSFNPFDKSIVQAPSTTLFNIHTGKSAPEEVTSCLLNIQRIGEERHANFVVECHNNPSRFEEPIQRVKLLTFQQTGATNRRASDLKIAELKCSRDLMGRLLVLATKKNLDLHHVFRFPLTPVPLSLSYVDGTIAKTQKSSLFQHLEKQTGTPTHVPMSASPCIVDGNFLLRTLPPNLPPTFGALAVSILIHVTSLSSDRVDIVFDTYEMPSIKAKERARRGAVDKEFKIVGPDQARPKNFNDALNSTSFKKELPSFLVKEWQRQHNSDLIGDRDIYVGHLSECLHIFVENGSVKCENVDSLQCNHAEADTRVCLHAKHVDNVVDTANIIVRASDTDIAVILIHHSFKFSATLWMDTGTVSGRNRRCVNLTRIAANLGPRMCEALPAFHAFTGTDYTSAFVRKGKLKPLKLLEKSRETQDAFIELTTSEISHSAEKTLMSFTATMFGDKHSQSHSLNEYRYEAFEKAFGPKVSSKNPFQKMKGIDAGSLPPCEAELRQHLRRASFVAKMWSMADEQIIEQHPSSTNGWELVDNRYDIIWFDGPQLPDTLMPDDSIDSSDEDDDPQMEMSSDDDEEEMQPEESD